jgi:galactokinase/mevalonate kinase-like predicted kinase
MQYSLTIPARINVLGNPADANEGAHATISVAIETRAGAFLEEADELALEYLARDAAGEWKVVQSQRCDPFSLVYDGPFDLLKGTINRLAVYSPEFRRKLAAKRFKISIWTDVPRHSGLGGSSLPVLLALAGLRALYDLEPQKHNDYVLAELTQRVEGAELGITCGFADRYVPLFGGIAYLDYRGKLHHKSIGQEPYATYERLDAYVEHLPLVLVYTGLKRDSGDVHGVMRPRYLEEHARWWGGEDSLSLSEAPLQREAPFMVRIMAEIGDTAWQGKMALLEHDWDTFGALMNQNHRLVNEMMEYCGFREGAGWANNLLIETALDNGALGAKLTGAGSGGSVFALVRPGQEEHLVEVLRQTAADNGLTQAQVYKCQIARQGLIISAAAD